MPYKKMAPYSIYIIKIRGSGKITTPYMKLSDNNAYKL